MQPKIVYMLKNTEGTLLPFTSESSHETCEAYCQQNVLEYARQKEAGCTIVPVEIREVAPRHVGMLQDAADRVGAFLKQRAAARGLHPGEISVMNAGSDREASLFTADLQALVDFAGAAGKA
jgi:hypothetical protein